MSYARFGAMIVTSTLVMFGLMYLNTWAGDHIFFSQTRAWMALLMGAVMAFTMIGFMWEMYRNTLSNGLVFAASLWLVQSPATVTDLVPRD